jgi:hypothetical protein
MVLKHKYHELSEGKNLPIFGISTKYLKEYVTSERDILRKITRIPGDEFRLWEEDISPEEHSSISHNKTVNSTLHDDYQFDDDNLFNEFVIVERLDV